MHKQRECCEKCPAALLCKTGAKLLMTVLPKNLVVNIYTPKKHSLRGWGVLTIRECIHICIAPTECPCVVRGENDNEGYSYARVKEHIDIPLRCLRNWNKRWDDTQPEER